jgi:hypothetical protein
VLRFGEARETCVPDECNCAQIYTDQQVGESMILKGLKFNLCVLWTINSIFILKNVFKDEMVVSKMSHERE